MISGKVHMILLLLLLLLITHIHKHNIKTGRPPFSTILEFRGKVFSVGGDEGEYTIPNFLSRYTGKSISKGAPKGITLPLSRGKQLNNAVTYQYYSVTI
jgi:hypothetical protein